MQGWWNILNDRMEECGFALAEHLKGIFPEVMQRFPSKLLFVLFSPLLVLSLSAIVDTEIRLPPGFQATVIADHLGQARQLAVRENGDIYVALRTDVDLNYLIALRDSTGDGTMDVVKYFGEVGSMVKSLQLYENYLYVGATDQIVRYPMREGRLLPAGMYEVIVTGFPTPRAHRSKNITFDGKGNLYVSAGAPATLARSRIALPNLRANTPATNLPGALASGNSMLISSTRNTLRMASTFATGIRNAVAIQYDQVKDELYTASNGRDGLYQQWDNFTMKGKVRRIHQKNSISYGKARTLGGPMSIGIMSANRM
jgi:glucose/arabinose dehydrogenase